MFDRFHEDSNRFSRRAVVITLVTLTVMAAACGAGLYALYSIAQLF